ncbi:MAG: glycosyltransferase family 2 protein [Thermoanaerobaculales bacterium]|jgi:glycosyltransferase involved in cell wall biosynthesis|nr:glycosyltransferase family 2 protein [Thermoanaerobaculales bacterium]
MLPSVTVVIPSYNHEAFVGAAVASALASEGVDSLEVVVVDDGSTDASRDRLEAFRGDPRVRLNYQDNAGADAAINRGCELARGELIFILDSDDELAPDRVAVLGERLRANPAAVLAASWIRVVDAAGAELGVKQAWRTLPPWPAPSAGPFLSDLGDPRLALLETNWISTTSNMAFPAALLRDHGLRFLPLRYAHDWDFALAASRLGGIELVETPLVSYRVHGANTIGEGDAAGQGRMRFEIQWVVARHAAGLLRSAARSDAELVHLRRLLAASAPTFGRDSVFDQLLLLRGLDPTSPASYDALLEAGHPFSTAAIELLGG